MAINNDRLQKQLANGGAQKSVSNTANTPTTKTNYNTKGSSNKGSIVSNVGGTKTSGTPVLQSDTDVAKYNVPNTSTSSTPKPTGYVNTNTSYNGNYVGVDLGTDYQAKMNDAIASGDYYAAAQYEAARNAKINYLNSIGQNTGNYGTTTNYVSEYSGNNQGGQAYNPKLNYSDFKSGTGVPNDWTTLNVGGIRYKRDDTGNIYQYTGTNADTGQEQWRLKGSGINPQTGEWTYNNYEDAKQAAYDAYRAATGDYTGTLSPDYINRVLNGTNNQYQEQLAEKEYQDWLAKIQVQQTVNTNTNYRPGRNDDDGWSYDENGNLDLMSQWMREQNVTDPNKRQILHVNSFETDPVNPDDYHNYGRQQYFYGLRNYR